MKKIASTFLFVFLMLQGYSQDNLGVEMATGLRTSGKIYVVVTVLSLIFVGLTLYLFSIDKKISKIEKNENI